MNNKQRIEAIKAGCWATIDEDNPDWIVECIEDVIAKETGAEAVQTAAEEIYNDNKDLFDKFWAWADSRTMYEVHKEADKWFKENLK